MCIELCALQHGCYTLAFLKINYQLKDKDPNSLFQVILYPRKIFTEKSTLISVF